VTQKQDYLIRIVFDNDRTWLLGSIAVDRSIVKARNGGEDTTLYHIIQPAFLRDIQYSTCRLIYKKVDV